MYGVAGTVVSKIAPHTEASEPALLVHLLAGYGSIIGRHAHCVVDGAEHFTNLFCTCVGATAKGCKGTSWNRISEILRLVDPIWAKDHIQSGLSSGEGLVAAVERESSASDSDTPVVDRRLFVLEAEFASVLKVMTREGNTLSATIRNAWDTGSFQIMVKKNPIKVDDAHITIVSHVTADELRRQMKRTDTGNGFANRFLWAQSVRSKSLPEGGSLTDKEKEELANSIKPAVEFGHKAGLIERDGGAKKLWAEVYPELSDGRLGLFGAVTSRAEAQVLRLSLIYALLDCSPNIKRVHLEAALALWDYCERTAQWIFGGSLEDNTADEIMSVLAERPEGMTQSEIMDHFGRHKSARQLSRSLSHLQGQGYVRPEIRKTAGRDAKVWIANYREQRRRSTNDREDHDAEAA